MNVAIIVWGFYRQFDAAVEFWNESYSEYNPDYFFSIWEDSMEKCTLTGFNFDIRKKATRKDITKHYPDANINIFKNKACKLVAAERIWFLLEKAVDSILQSNKKYDVIIVKRADAFEWRDYKITDNLKNNTIYTYQGRQRDSYGNPHYDFGDIFFYGRSDSMVKFIKGFVNSKYLKLKDEFCPHKSPDQFLWESDLDIEIFPGNHHEQLVRPIHLFMFPSNKPIKEFLDENAWMFNGLEGLWHYIRTNRRQYYFISEDEIGE